MTLRKNPPGDLDRQIGVCLGLGMSREGTAEYLGISPNTVRSHLDVYADFITKVQAETEAAAAKFLSTKVTKAVGSAKERMESLYDRAFQITEKLIQKAEDEGDAITVERAMEIHKAITVWAGKHVVSEAPKRLQMEGTVNHDHRVVPDEAINRLTAFMAKHSALLPPSEVIDVEPIADA